MRWLSVGILLVITAVQAVTDDSSQTSASSDHSNTMLDCEEQAAIEVEAVISIYESECLDKEKIGIHEVLQYKHDVKLAENDPVYKCFIACFLEFNGIMSDCELMTEKEMAMASEEDMPKIFHDLVDCRDRIRSTDRCECGYEMMKCIQEIN